MEKQSKQIPLARPILTDEEKAAVIAVLESGKYVRGEENAKFEKEFANYNGVRHAVTFSSGTAALHVALLALGIKSGDEVITTPLTFFATVEAIMLTGAKPVFVDIDPSTYNLNVDQIEQKLTERTKVIIPVHLYGQPANIKEVIGIAKKKGLYMIEDACQAHGAEFLGKKVGAFGDSGCFSFYPSKNLMVANEGGMVTTNDDSLAEQMRSLKDHGRTSTHVHQRVGLNYHLGEVQAAIGRIQLRNLDRTISKRRKLAGIYKSELSNYSSLTLPYEIPDAKHVYHLFVIQYEKRGQLQKMLEDDGVKTGIHYPIPCHKQPAYTNMYGDIIKLPVVEKAAERILSLPMHQYISEDEVYYVTDCMSKTLKSLST